MDREPVQTDFDYDDDAAGSYSGSSYAADYPPAEPPRASMPSRLAGYKTSALVADTLNTALENTEDYLNDLSDNYQFDLRPEYRLKVRKRLPLATVGVNYELNADRYELVAKAGTNNSHPVWRASRPFAFLGRRTPELQLTRAAANVLSKVVVTPQQTDLRVYSAKAHWSVLSLQCVYGHDWTTKHSGLHWRLSTAWDITPSSVGRKAVLPKVVPGLKTSVRWDVSVEKAPDMAGGFGTGSQAIDYDLGKFRISLPRVQASLKL